MASEQEQIVSLTQEEVITPVVKVQYEGLSPEEKEKVDLIFNEIDVENSSAILQYGVKAQSNISTFSDNVLNQVKAKDSGYVGEILTDLMVNVKGLDVDSINSKKGFMGFFGSVKRSTDKFVARYEKMSVNIDKIISQLDKSRMTLLKDITLLDNLYDKNLEYMHELEYYIMAGERKIDELNNSIIPGFKVKAETSGDQADVQKLNDYMQLVTRLEKKIHDLKLSRMITIQTGPQVRLIQNGDQVLVEKIQSSILNTIPLWKNQIIIAISLFRQEGALKLQQEVNEATNEILKKNSQMLKQNTIEVAQESEKGIVEIETLKQVNKDLIETIEETLTIQKEGRDKRQQAEQELAQMEQEIANKLIEASN